MKYQSRPQFAEATRWFKNGDHPKDNVWRRYEDTGALPTEPREGAVVRYFRHPSVQGVQRCEVCKNPFKYHGWIDSGGSGQAVCPGAFVVTTGEGYYAVSADVFLKHYSPALAMTEPCIWQKTIFGSFDTECGGGFKFNAGSAGSNKFLFCPFCGRAIAERPFEPEPSNATSTTEKGNTMNTHGHGEGAQMKKGQGNPNKPEDPGQGGESPAAPVAPGTVIIPNRIIAVMAPDGLQQRQEYDLAAGVTVATEATTDAVNWVETGTYEGPQTASVQIPLYKGTDGQSVAWRVVAK